MFLSCVCVLLRHVPLRRADRLFRGVLQAVCAYDLKNSPHTSCFATGRKWDRNIKVVQKRSADLVLGYLGFLCIVLTALDQCAISVTRDCNAVGTLGENANYIQDDFFFASGDTKSYWISWFFCVCPVCVELRRAGVTNVIAHSSTCKSLYKIVALVRS